MASFAQGKINKFGIHILEPSELESARELVGDWGWITVVIRDDDLNQNKWQSFMDHCREKHVIPIVRIATHNENSHWVKPRPEDIDKLVSFLSSLNWPVKDQYVTIFNEPNHAKEWGGEVNPKEYAKILTDFSSKLKVQNEKFRILNAGLDLAAPNSKETMDAYKFMAEMKAAVPDIFAKLDGWCSHSYPNHGFVGKPWETGRVSIKGYDWELWVLKNHFGLQKDLPVFITETGWPKNISNGKKQIANSKNKYYDEVTAATYLKNAFESVWLNDPRVTAVTPFVLNYSQDLFDEFSWFDPNGYPYPQYELVKSMAKESWWPYQETAYSLKSVSLPTFLPAKTEYKGKIVLENIGQSIWGERESFEVPASSEPGLIVSNLVLGDKKIRPGEKVEIDFTLKSSTSAGEFTFNWENMPTQKIKVLPPSFLAQARYNVLEKFLINLKKIF